MENTLQNPDPNALATLRTASGAVELANSLPYREIWLCDFEFYAPDGERPDPVCMVAREYWSGRTLRLWRDELRRLKGPPIDTGPDSLFVAYYASAELGCFRALGWSYPARILDLYAEFRAAVNGYSAFRGYGLLGALAHYGLDSMAAEEKRDLRSLIMRGGPWSPEQQADILDYCESDVLALRRLLPAMLPGILSEDPGGNLGRALLRGRYMAAAAGVEWNGIPLDMELLHRLSKHWDSIKLELIAAVDAGRGIFEGTTFKRDRFAAYLYQAGIPWPRLESGALELSRDTFRQQARAHPQEIGPLYELRHNLSELRLHELAVGSDGRNRTLVSPFGTKTGRNAPRASRFIFGPSAWLRSLIKPPPGYGLAYVDFASQEYAIAAGLSGDPNMAAAYESGDVYLAFAKQAGLAPPEATKETHKSVRDRCKALVLGISYGMGEGGLAVRMDVPRLEARTLLRAHRETYPVFWAWSERFVNAALLSGKMRSVLGWHGSPGLDPNPRSVMNFPMQAAGGDMLRVAACRAAEAGLSVCALVHDAILIEAPLSRLDQDVEQLRGYMAEAGRLVTGGLEVRTDVYEVRYPKRYTDERGAEMFERALQLLEKVERRAA